jgi:Nucleotidyl transferase of unknown function (DUF2204)
MSDSGLSSVQRTLRIAAATLRDAEIPFALGGSLACWARGGPPTDNDVDLMVLPSEATRALAALEAAGMTGERPPEDWLLKAHSQDVTVDLIFAALGLQVTRAFIDATEELTVLAMRMRVLSVEDVLVSRLLALDAHRLDYTGSLAIARALREQVDFKRLAGRVAHSPFARAFLVLLGDLGIVESGTADPVAAAHGPAEVNVRRVTVG